MPFGAGTDVPINLSIPGYSLHSELEMLVEAGLEPIDAIAAATIKRQYFSLGEGVGNYRCWQARRYGLIGCQPTQEILEIRSKSILW